MTNQFCELLKGNKCSILNSCFRLGLGVRKKCDFPIHYKCLTQTSNDPPITKEIKEKILKPVIQRWKQYAQRPTGGKKDMTGGPLEKGIREWLGKRLQSKAKVHETGKKIEIEKVYMNVDVLVEPKKPDLPRSVVSVKSWIAPTFLRETFSKAYLCKLMYGLKGYRIFMVGLLPLSKSLKKLGEICKPYLDGVYSLSDEPYFDELVAELENIYST